MNFEDALDAYDNEPLQVTCARCGKEGTSETFILEEGDEWECPKCWEICEEAERLAARDGSSDREGAHHE